VTDETTGRGPGRTIADEAVDLGVLTDEVLPALIARLRASRLAELEVRKDGWRIRLRRDLRAVRRSPRGHAGDAHRADDEDPSGEARSPAVGYFSPARGLVVGQGVTAGDTLGSVDVLGIAQEVTAPVGGIVSAVLAETGQAVEYGQVLVEIDPLADDLGSPEREAADGLVTTPGAAAP
jgi:biotin carboxyl carrier protein